MNHKRRSARELFSACAYSFKAIYLDGVLSENDATRRGSSFHAARENYVRLLWANRVEADHELADAAWHKAAVDMPVPNEARNDARQLFVRWSEGYVLDLATFVDVETKLETPFGATLALDELHAVGDTLRVIDSKTYWRIPSEAELRGSFQCRFYSAALRRLYQSFSKIEMVFEFVRFNTSITIVLSQEEMDDTERQIAEQDEAMDMAEVTGLYPATPGSHCGRCVAACPVLDNALRAAGRLTSAQEASEAVGQLAVLETQRGHLQTALRAYSELHGPVEAGGIEWAHRKESRFVYPAKAVQAVLDEANVPFRLLMSGSAVKALVNSKKKYTQIAEQVRALGEERTTTKFGPKRTHDLDEVPDEVADSFGE